MQCQHFSNKKIEKKILRFFQNSERMKFCKKCRKHIVEKLENGIQCSIDSVKICTCPGRVVLVHNSVVKRDNSELGVQETRKCFFG